MLKKASIFLSTVTVVTTGVLSEASAAVALNPPVLTNVALNKPTFGDTAFSAPTARGNDGITGAAASGNWTHADYPTSAVPYPGEVGNAPNPYWEVDLQGSFTIEQMVVSDRNGCCTPNRLNGSTITLFDAGGGIVGTESISGLPDNNPGAATTATFSTTYANVARARIDGLSNFFQFSEFEAIASIATPLNWAMGAATQVYDNTGAPRNAWPGLPATNATDGAVGAVTHPEDQPDHTNWYLEIDLGQEIYIDNISLTGRGFQDACCPERLRDYSVEFLNAAGVSQFTYHHTGITQFTDNIDIIGLTGGLGPQTRTVRIINRDGTQFGPQVAEFQAFGVVPEPSSSLLLLAASTLSLRRRRN